MVTIKDVAEKAQVSITTVSHVVNGTRYVSDELKARVFTVMEQLNYHPNSLARSLRVGQTNTIGLISPDNSNPFFAEIARLIEDEGYNNGYSVILCNTDDDEAKEARYVDVLIAKQADGVIFMSAGESIDCLQRLWDQNIPIVVTDREVPNALADMVLVDSQKGGYLVTRYLIELGHKRIACITGPTRATPSGQRVLGFDQAMAEAGLAVNPIYITNGDFRSQSGELAMNRLLALKTPPTAVFACNDLMAIGAIRAARNNGLRIPEDISIAGYDDISFSQAMHPALTTVSQPYSEITKIATDLLIQRISEHRQNNRAKEFKRFLLDPKLVIRDSCAKL
jgi:LacI family transcriptional regulator